MLSRLVFIVALLTLSLVVGAVSEAATPVRVDSVGNCKVVRFINTGSYGPFQVKGPFLLFSVDGDPDNDQSSIGAAVTVNGCSYVGSSTVCSCDLPTGAAECSTWDGVKGRTTFIVSAPQTVTVNVLSTIREASFSLCNQ